MATLVQKDRVKETTATTGTGTWTLAGAVTGFQAFSVIGDGNTCNYAASDGGANWEVGVGTYVSSGNTLARTTIVASSNSNAAVNFTTGPTIWCDMPATALWKADANTQHAAYGNNSQIDTVLSPNSDHGTFPTIVNVQGQYTGDLNAQGPAGICTIGSSSTFSHTGVGNAQIYENFSTPDVPSTSSGPISHYYAYYGTATTHGTGAIAEMQGAHFEAQNLVAGGNVTAMYGTYTTAEMTAGTATNLYGLFANVFGSGGTTTNGYAGYFDSTSGATGFTNLYNVYITDSTGRGATNAWNFYSKGATARNVIEGTANIVGATTLGTQQTTQGSLVLSNTAAGAFATTVKSSNSASAAWTLTLPTTAGTNTYMLTTDGSGTTSWTVQPAGASGANPMASVGLTAVNGSAVTFLRSDGAPALDQTIAPTWTGLHTHSAGLAFGNQTVAFGTTGAGIQGAWTHTDSTTGAGTVAADYGHKFGITTLTTPTNAITITNAYGAWFEPPAAGTHVTITSKWAAGFNAQVSVTGTTNTWQFVLSNTAQGYGQITTTTGTDNKEALYVRSNGGSNDLLRVLGNGSVILNKGTVATNATDGFLYIPTCAGTPTGTPTAQSGRVALVYDTTNHQFWIYDGAWLQPKTPAGAALVTWQ